MSFTRLPPVFIAALPFLTPAVAPGQVADSYMRVGGGGYCGGPGIGSLYDGSTMHGKPFLADQEVQLNREAEQAKHRVDKERRSAAHPTARAVSDVKHSVKTNLQTLQASFSL